MTQGRKLFVCRLQVGNAISPVVKLTVPTLSVQPERGWLNEVAPLNMSHILGPDVKTHESNIWLNEVAPLNISVQVDRWTS